MMSSNTVPSIQLPESIETGSTKSLLVAIKERCAALFLLCWNDDRVKQSRRFSKDNRNCHFYKQPNIFIVTCVSTILSIDNNQEMKFAFLTHFNLLLDVETIFLVACSETKSTK